jgi:hypothetical protein
MNDFAGSIYFLIAVAASSALATAFVARYIWRLRGESPWKG